jgi:dihydroneopterin aldolase
MDKIIIRDLRLDTFVGIFPKEKKIKQKVILNIEMVCDFRKACLSDNLSDTVDYKSVKQKIIVLVETGKFNLIEKIAEDTARICLSTKGVNSVKVTVDKPGALTKARSAAVQIERP